MGGEERDLWVKKQCKTICAHLFSFDNRLFNEGTSPSWWFCTIQKALLPKLNLLFEIKF